MPCVRPDADQLSSDEIGVAGVVVHSAVPADEAPDVGFDNLLDEELLHLRDHGHQHGGDEAASLEVLSCGWRQLRRDYVEGDDRHGVNWRPKAAAQ
eukprot:16449998-Heterocapsa_arctica.AAC.1